MSGKLSGHLARGAAAEQLAARHLQSRGLHLVTTNFRGKLGELDLVMTEGEVLVVVEVRFLARITLTSPAESVGREKQRRIVRTTRLFLLQFPRYADWPIRFDVVDVTGDLNAPLIRWLPAAFNLDDMASR